MASGGAVAGARIPAWRRFLRTTSYSGCGIDNGCTRAFECPAYVTRASAIDAPKTAAATAPAATLTTRDRRRAAAARDASSERAARAAVVRRARFDRLRAPLRSSSSGRG